MKFKFDFSTSKEKPILDILLIKEKRLLPKLLLKLKKIKKTVIKNIKYINKWIFLKKKLRFLLRKKIILYIKKILKNETSIKSDKITIWVLVINIDERLLTGRNPPDDIIDSAKFKEL